MTRQQQMSANFFVDNALHVVGADVAMQIANTHRLFIFDKPFRHLERYLE